MIADILDIETVRKGVASLKVGQRIRVVYDQLPFGEEGLNPCTIGRITDIKMGQSSGFFRKATLPEVWVESPVGRFNAVRYVSGVTPGNGKYYYPTSSDVVE